MIVRGIHLPDGAQHFAEQIAANPLYRNKGTYQWKKLDAALEACGTRRGHAVDVGAHVGLWSRVLSYEFARVTAFEPIAEFADCFRRNLARRAGVTLLQCGLGELAGTVGFSMANDGEGTACLALGGQFQVQMKRIDDIEISAIDFLKIDCEGSEANVIRGGEETIRRDRPVVLVEQKSRRTDAYGLPRLGAVNLLRSWGAAVIWDIKGDYCLAWRDGP